MRYQGRIVQDEMTVAECDSKNEARMKAELAHFAVVYRQDGPVRVDVKYGKGRWRTISQEDLK
jgi:hypothetical protein